MINLLNVVDDRGKDLVQWIHAQLMSRQERLKTAKSNESDSKQKFLAEVIDESDTTEVKWDSLRARLSREAQPVRKIFFRTDWRKRQRWVKMVIPAEKTGARW